AGWLRQDRVIGEIAVGLLAARRGPRRLTVARRTGDPGDRPSAARAAIATLERVDRGYYSGLVGWSAEDGDGEWVVTIRGAEIRDRTLRMFAGAEWWPDRIPRWSSRRRAPSFARCSTRTARPDAL
ncbi:MAG: entC, partial [Pseudonocardia sp.]|nr:entC [Pseudonocardia sp.]